MADFDTDGMAADFGEMLNGITQSSVVFSSKRKSGTQTVRACIGEAISGATGSEEGIRIVEAFVALGEDNQALVRTHSGHLQLMQANFDKACAIHCGRSNSVKF